VLRFPANRVHVPLQVLVSPEKEQQFKVAVDWLGKKHGVANVVQCWHGSSLTNIENIAQNGFGTFSHPENRRSYGDGVYLGVSASVRSST
jgi:ribosomal protein S2